MRFATLNVPDGQIVVLAKAEFDRLAQAIYKVIEA